MLLSVPLMALPKQLLVPTDFGPSSDRAVAYAADLAKAFGAEIVIMHAWEIPMLGFPDGAFIATAELATRVLEAAQQGLNDAMKLLEGKGVKARGLLKQGPTWQMIVETAKEVDAGMIVIGTHGRHGLPRALLGSVAEKVVRTAHTPVLTVHVDDRTEA
jgi:nucleotide-binding universal stress UspA family protein